MMWFAISIGSIATLWVVLAVIDGLLSPVAFAPRTGRSRRERLACCLGLHNGGSSYKDGRFTCWLCGRIWRRR